LIGEMRRERKVVAAFGMATGLVAKAGVVGGEEVSYPPVPMLHAIFKQEGAKATSATLAVSNGLVTGHDPRTIASFARAVAWEMGLRP
jgi:putative intracellular protease/amidase